MVDTTPVSIVVRRIAPDLLDTAVSAVVAQSTRLHPSVAALNAIWELLNEQQQIDLVRALPAAPLLEFNSPSQDVRCAHPGMVLVTAPVSFDTLVCTHLTAVQPVTVRNGSVTAVADIASLRVEERLIVGALKGHVARVRGHLYAGTIDVDVLYGGDVDAFEMRGLEAHLGRLRLRNVAHIAKCTLREALGPGLMNCPNFEFAA